MFQVRHTSNYNLTYINQQLAMLKEKMVKEQMRLNILIVNKDIQIKWLVLVLDLRCTKYTLV